MAKYSGAEWCDQRGKVMSPFGRKVADLLGQVYQGIYHLGHDIGRADLSTHGYVRMTISRWSAYFSTYDYNHLTVMIILCHDAGIRLEIEPAGPWYFRLVFSQRTREGNMLSRMPTIEEQIRNIRANFSIPSLVLENEPCLETSSVE